MSSPELCIHKVKIVVTTTSSRERLRQLVSYFVCKIFCVRNLIPLIFFYVFSSVLSYYLYMGSGSKLLLILYRSRQSRNGVKVEDGGLT